MIYQILKIFIKKCKYKNNNKNNNKQASYYIKENYNFSKTYYNEQNKFTIIT